MLPQPGSLDGEERAVMQKHTIQGRHIIENMLQKFRLEDMASTDVLRNIAELHHEAVNGCGYPCRLKGGYRSKPASLRLPACSMR